MKKTIMIVDDNRDVRYAISCFLDNTGKYIVTEADNGESCLELLKKDQIPD